MSLTIDEIRELNGWQLTRGPGIGVGITTFGGGWQVLTMARDWYLAHRDVIRAAAFPEDVIGEAAERETTARSRYTVVTDGRQVSVAGIRLLLRNGDLLETALPGALPFEGAVLWNAFAELELWQWDGIDEDTVVQCGWSGLTEDVAKYACGEVAISVITWLLKQDDGEPGTTEGDGEGS